jgi:CheY-like chemotaxis protein
MDTGTGIPQNVLPHIFDPFYTTKGIGQGSGLGLAMVYAFVKQTGGVILVETKEGAGTTFQIHLPITQETPPRSLAVMRPTEASSVNGTILLVEDDEIVRNLAFETLESAGYHVLVAQNGEDAINLARSSEKDIHLLLTDVVMPGMPGQDLALRLSSIRPNLQVLFVSGYMDNSAVLSAGKCLTNGWSYLQKPFLPDQFLAEVRNTLSMSRSG